jgi:uroporphyrinogen-III decarboxylase
MTGKETEPQKMSPGLLVAVQASPKLGDVEANLGAMSKVLAQPYLKKINDWIREHTNWKTFYHSCGSICDLLDDFIDMGVDIVNPVQTGAEGMARRFLKDTYGDRITFWGGGVDTQHVLPFEGPEVVKAEVIKNLSIWPKNGGFVFGSIHNLQPDIPAENLKALFDTFREWRETSRLIEVRGEA